MKTYLLVDIAILSNYKPTGPHAELNVGRFFSRKSGPF